MEGQTWGLVDYVNPLSWWNWYWSAEPQDQQQESASTTASEATPITAPAKSQVKSPVSVKPVKPDTAKQNQATKTDETSQTPASHGPTTKSSAPAKASAAKENGATAGRRASLKRSETESSALSAKPKPSFTGFNASSVPESKPVLLSTSSSGGLSHLTKSRPRAPMKRQPSRQHIRSDWKKFATETESTVSRGDPPRSFNAAPGPQQFVPQPGDLKSPLKRSATYHPMSAAGRGAMPKFDISSVKLRRAPPKDAEGGNPPASTSQQDFRSVLKSRK